MTRILAIRPEPGLSATLAAGRVLGLEIEGQPLFEIEPIGWEAPDPDTIDALLIGSANGVRYGGPNLLKLLRKPVYAVGKATANGIAEAGFKAASIGSGGLQAVLDTIKPPARLLRITGQDHVDLVPPDGVSIETAIAYRSIAKSLDPAALNALRGRAIVLLHSGIAAEHFFKECKRLEVDLSAIELAAMAPRIASCAGKGWAAIHVSEAPDDAALLAMVQGLCQE